MAHRVIEGTPLPNVGINSRYLILLFHYTDTTQFGGLRVRCKQRRKAGGIAARHTAFGRHAVHPDMAPSSGEASDVAGHVVAVNETEIKLGFRALLQPG